MTENQSHSNADSQVDPLEGGQGDTFELSLENPPGSGRLQRALEDPDSTFRMAMEMPGATHEAGALGAADASAFGTNPDPSASGRVKRPAAVADASPRTDATPDSPAPLQAPAPVVKAGGSAAGWGQDLKKKITDRAESEQKGSIIQHKLRLSDLIDCVGEILEKFGQDPEAAKALAQNMVGEVRQWANDKIASLTHDVEALTKNNAQHQQYGKQLQEQNQLIRAQLAQAQEELGRLDQLTQQLQQAQQLNQQLQQQALLLQQQLQQAQQQAAQEKRRADDGLANLSVAAQERDGARAEAEALRAVAAEAESYLVQVTQISEDMSAAKSEMQAQLDALLKEKADLLAVFEKLFGALPKGKNPLDVATDKPDELVQALQSLLDRQRKLEEERRFADLLPVPRFDATKARLDAKSDDARAARIAREQDAARARYAELRKRLLETREGTLADFATLSRVARLAFSHERELDGMDGG